MPKQGFISIDGSVDFSGGVNSYVVATIQSERNPNGLKRNQVAWMDNATVRGGGITQRPGWRKLGNYPNGASGLYQGKFTYEPDGEDPYIVAAVGGHIWKLPIDNPSAGVDLSAQFGVTLPAEIDRYYFCQAEQFMVIQCGDLAHLPLFWDGTTLRRSLGLSGMGVPSAPRIPGVIYGHISFMENSGFVVPALGATITVGTIGNPVSSGSVGTNVFLLNGETFLPDTPAWQSGTLLGYASIRSSWQITNIVPNVSVDIKLLGYDGSSAPAVIFGPGFLFYTLITEPTQFMPGTPEIPSAGTMDYYMGRMWYAQGRQYSAGDIVGGSSGTQPYNFRDSVLKVTENPLAIGGDGFTVPTNSGNIRAIKHSANINTQLGQGQLYIFTRRSIYSLNVPVTRNDWIAADNNKQPLQTVAQVTNGSVNDRSVVTQNGDLFFQSIEPAIRSQKIAVRNFQQWGDVPISINEQRILRFNDRALMQYSSGISFDNRMLQTVLPVRTPVGVAHRAIVPLNFDLISTLEEQLPPAWEGMYEGLNVLEMCTSDFNGRPRGLMSVYSEMDRNIQLWEISDSDRFEGDDNRVTWYVEFPAFTWGDEFQMKKLIGCEMWFDRIYGEVDFSLDYRPDGDPCWYPWNRWQWCTARNTCEDVHNPVCPYPKDLAESFRQTINMPSPPEACQSVMKRPAYMGFQFQPRLAIKGFCRIRGFILKAQIVAQETYDDMVCLNEAAVR